MPESGPAAEQGGKLENKSAGQGRSGANGKATSVGDAVVTSDVDRHYGRIRDPLPSGAAAICELMPLGLLPV